MIRSTSLENIVDSIIVFILLLAFNGITLYPFVLLWFVYYRKAGRKAHYKTVVKYAFAFLVVFQILTTLHSNWLINTGLKRAVSKIEWERLEVREEEIISELYINSDYKPSINDLFINRVCSIDRYEAVMRKVLTNEQITIENIRSAFRGFISENDISYTDNYKCNDEECYSDMYVLFRPKNKVLIINWILNLKHTMGVYVVRREDSITRTMALRCKLFW
jgi:hypothetical protein